MNTEKTNNSSLALVKSPYFIKYSSNVLKAIYLAQNSNLFVKYNINPKLIELYKEKKNLLPLWILEAACNLNKENLRIPIEFQNVWYCLHDCILMRRQQSGRIFRTKVNFTPCYVQWDERIKNLIDSAMLTLQMNKKEFSLFCGYNPRRLRFYQKKVPITIILKVCQILKINPWNLLVGYRLFGRSRDINGVKIDNEKPDINMYKLLIWLRTEGHMELGSTHIEVNQKYNDNALKAIQEIIMNKFRIKSSSFHYAMGIRGEKRLIISSSALRQLLCLKYDCSLGYKSGSLKSLNLSRLSTQQCLELFPPFVESEGCLSYQYTRNRKKKLPKFEFIIKDKEIVRDCIEVLQKLGYSPRCYINKNLYKIGIYNSKEVIELVNKSKKYFFDMKKIDYLREVCTSGIGL